MYKLIPFTIHPPVADSDSLSLAQLYGYSLTTFSKQNNKWSITLESFGPVRDTPINPLITPDICPPKRMNPTLALQTGVTFTGIELSQPISSILKQGYLPGPGVPDWRNFKSYLYNGYQNIGTSRGIFKSGNGFIGTSTSYNVAKTFGQHYGVVAVFGSGFDVNSIILSETGRAHTWESDLEVTYNCAIPASQIMAFIPPHLVKENTASQFSIYIDNRILAQEITINSWVPASTILINTDSNHTPLETPFTFEDQPFTYHPLNPCLQKPDGSRINLASNTFEQLSADIGIQLGGSVWYPSLVFYRLHTTPLLTHLLSRLDLDISPQNIANDLYLKFSAGACRTHSKSAQMGHFSIPADPRSDALAKRCS